MAASPGRAIRASVAKFSMCGPKRTGLPADDRLDRILAAVRGQTLADEDNRGDCVPISQLAGGVENEQSGVVTRTQFTFAAKRHLQRRALKMLPNFPRPLHVARRDDQRKRGKSSADLERSRRGFFFARMRASAEKNRAVGDRSRSAAALRRGISGSRSPAGSNLMLPTYCDATRVQRRAPSSARIFRFLHANEIEQRKVGATRNGNCETAAPSAARAAR